MQIKQGRIKDHLFVQKEWRVKMGVTINIRQAYSEIDEFLDL